jgi:DNA replication protein DnaC
MTVNHLELERSLKSLRLSGIQATLETRALQAAQGQMSFLEAFSALICDELDRRRSKLVERQFSLSGLPERKSPSDFDWSFNPKVPRKYCLELLTLKFILAHEDVLLLGQPGTGKSFIAKAIATSAVINGHKVLYREAHSLFEDIAQATALGSKSKFFSALSSCDLLVIDDLALRKLPPHAGETILEIVMNRYEKKSTLITSNRILEDWGKIFGDQTISSAILDRLMHHGHLLKFEGRSYRLAQAASRANAKLDSKSPNM